MSRVTHGVLAAAAVALLAGGAAAAYAQTTDAERTVREAQEDAHDAQMHGRDAREAAEHGRMAAQDGRRMAQDARKMVMRHEMDAKAHADHLRNILQLRPNQEAALTAYLEASKPQVRVVQFDRETAPKTTPERLAQMEKRLVERETAGRARIDATRKFYNQLDERQKKAFDELPMMMGPMMMDMGGMRAIQIIHRGPGMEHPPMPPMPPRPPQPPPSPRL